MNKFLIGAISLAVAFVVYKFLKPGKAKVEIKKEEQQIPDKKPPVKTSNKAAT